MQKCTDDHVTILEDLLAQLANAINVYLLEQQKHGTEAIPFAVSDAKSDVVEAAHAAQAFLHTGDSR